MLEDVLGKIEVAVEKASAGRGGKGVEAVFEDVRTGEGFFEVVLVKLKGKLQPSLSLRLSSSLLGRC